MTVRWVIAHLYELPDDSRVKKHIGGEQATFSMTDHILADIRDLLNGNQYFTAVGALAQIEKPSERQKIARGVPDRIRRPGDPEPEKPRFATREELNQLLGQGNAKTRQALLARRRRKGL